MIVKMSNKGNLKISNKAMVRMLFFEQNSREKKEAGGVLMGRFILNSKDIVIDRVTIPMINDIRTRYTFIRKERMHQNIIQRAWEESNKTCNYIGEWHTHPEFYPKPSSQDYKNWKEILSTRIFSNLYLYFVIVGIKETRIWEGNRETNLIIRVK